MSELKELRSALNATTSTPGVDPAFDSAAINAVITKGIADLSEKFSQLYNMVPRRSLNGQPSKIWNVRVSDNESTRWGYSFSEGIVGSNTNSNTPSQGQLVQLVAVARSVRADWEVENFYREASASYYDAVQDEIRNAIETVIDKIERQMVVGNVAAAGGDANGFLGLRQLVNSNALGDTTNVYGIARASGKGYMDAQVVDADDGNFTISYLDNALDSLEEVRAAPGFFLVSIKRATEINFQLQAQQRFVNTMDIAGGFRVPTYLGVPIIKSKYMAKAGPANTDTVIFLMAAENLFYYELSPLRNKEATLGRQDSIGGFITQYAVPVVPRLKHNAIIAKLTVPQV